MIGCDAGNHCRELREGLANDRHVLGLERPCLAPGPADQRVDRHRLPADLGKAVRAGGAGKRMDGRIERPQLIAAAIGRLDVGPACLYTGERCRKLGGIGTTERLKTLPHRPEPLRHARRWYRHFLDHNLIVNFRRW